MKKISITSLAFAIGITQGLFALFLGWCAAFGWGQSAVILLSSFYIGYNGTFVGGIIGGIWGLADGIIAGLIIGYFYNIYAGKKKRHKKKDHKSKKRQGVKR
jgi:predicted histidine transporter YuiF (NhaC family)